jgi:hypothetical protein
MQIRLTKKHVILLISISLTLTTLLSCGYTQLSDYDAVDVEESGSEHICMSEEGAKEMSAQYIEFEESGYINFQLIGSYKVDSSGIRNFLRVSDIAMESFTWFEQFPSVENMHAFSNRINFGLPNFEFNVDDFADKYFVITIGRELVEIQYKFLGEPPWTPLTLVQSAITLSEQYNADILYLYATDPISMFPSDLAGGYNAFFFIKGAERVYKGQCVFELNGLFDDQR